jgi:hypothetical protein
MEGPAAPRPCSHGPAQRLLQLGLTELTGIDQIPPGAGEQWLNRGGLDPPAGGHLGFPATDGGFLLRIGGMEGSGVCCQPIIDAMDGGAEGESSLIGQEAGEPDHRDRVGQSGAELGAKAGEIHERRSEERRSSAPASEGVKGGEAACAALDAGTTASP